MHDDRDRQGQQGRTLSVSQGFVVILAAWRTQQWLAAISWDAADYVLASEAATR